MLDDGAKCIHDNGGDTFLHIAYSSEKEIFEKFDLLVKHNPYMINSKNKKGETVLHKAVMESNKEFVNYMLDTHLGRKDAILDINTTNQLKKINITYMRI